MQGIQLATLVGKLLPNAFRKQYLQLALNWRHGNRHKSSSSPLGTSMAQPCARWSSRSMLHENAHSYSEYNKSQVSVSRLYAGDPGDAVGSQVLVLRLIALQTPRSVWPASFAW